MPHLYMDIGDWNSHTHVSFSVSYIAWRWRPIFLVEFREVMEEFEDALVP